MGGLPRVDASSRGRARRSTCRGLRPGALDREDLLSALHACPCHSSAPCAIDLGPEGGPGDGA